MRLLSYLFKKESPKENRLAIIEVTAEALLGLFQLDGKSLLRMEGVPADARVQDMWVDNLSRTLYICIESEECPLVTEGSAISSICVTAQVTEWVPQEALVS